MRPDNTMLIRYHAPDDLRVPSVIVPVPESDDRNIIINHRHRDAARIMISRIERFAYDPRLLYSDTPGGSRE